MCLEGLSLLYARGIVTCRANGPSVSGPLLTEVALQMRRVLLEQRIALCRPFSGASDGIGAAYNRLINSGSLMKDESQAAIVERLDELEQSDNKGAYLWGTVGSGKSMLMDLLHTTSQPTGLRVHFHELMESIHTGIHALQVFAQPIHQLPV